MVSAAVLPTAGSASAKVEHPGRALLSYVARDKGVCLVRPDGTHAVRLTRWGSGRISWSPRGRYVAYERVVGLDLNHDALSKVAVADTRGHVRWSFGVGHNNSDPVWSPDGGHIAYYFVTGGYGGGGFDVARPDGSENESVFGCTWTGLYPFHCPAGPAWTADGHGLAVSDRDDATGDVSVFAAHIPSSGPRLLVRRADNPAYSPDGSRLAYVGWTGVAGIVFAAADGSNPRVIVQGTTLWWPTWSPDGSQIAFERATGGNDADVVVAKADGSGERTLASGAALPQAQAGIAWSPNGALIAFMRGHALLVARADGGGEHLVAHTGQTNVTPAWRPAVALPAAKRRRCSA
jgi:Tol biopolymer transport system component